MTRPVRQIPDLVYSEMIGYRPLELDLHLPETDGLPPVVVYIHGGGWRRGSRRHPLPRLGPGFYDSLVAQGFAVATVDYRLSGEARFPAAVDDVRSAVNTTVMATETGSKAVDAGSRQFGDLASAFKQIANLVSTTTEAAREIELSTKQQSTAVEQVNVAVANVTQASMETETSAGQTLQTVSQMAILSKDLLRIIQPHMAA